MKRPEWDLAAVAMTYLGWKAFDGISATSGRVAFYSMGGLLLIYLTWRIKSLFGWKYAPVFWFAAFVGSQQFACGLLYEHNGKAICDAGSDFPWTLITSFCALLVAIYYSRKNHERND